MYCCYCDLQQRHHPTPSCDGCACFWTDDVVPNPFKPLRMFAEEMRKAFENVNAKLIVTEPRPWTVVHMVPSDDTSIMPCCGKIPFEVSNFDKITDNTEDVTCGKVVGDGNK